MAKRELLVQLLERYHELIGSAGGGLRGRLHGDALLLPQHDPGCHVYDRLRCSCWRRSLVELERALAQLKAELPVAHAHLVARHRDSERIRRTVLWRDRRWHRAANERIVVSPFGSELDDHQRGRTPPAGRYDVVIVR